MVNKFHAPARPSDALPLTHLFSGDKLHAAEKDGMSIARLSKNVGLSLSGIISGEQSYLDTYQILTEKMPTIHDCKMILDWSVACNESVYLLFGTRGAGVLPKEIAQEDISKCLSELAILIESSTPFMLARKNPNIQGGMTAMDTLSTEGMTRKSIAEFVDRLLDCQNISGKNRHIFDPKSKGRSLSKKDISAGQLRLTNTVYSYAVQFLQFLGIHLTDEQKKRKFHSIDDFKEHIYKIKPELHENKEGYEFRRRDGVGMIIECALVRAMDHVYDTFSSERFRTLDAESELIFDKLKSISAVRMTNISESSFDIRYTETGGYFEGTIYLRKKNFFKILLKMAYNRKYGSSEALKDLLGMRFETLNPGEENMTNAVKFFQSHFFDLGAVYEQKGNLLSHETIVHAGIYAKLDVTGKSGTNSKLVNGDITGTVSHKIIGQPMKQTGNIEMQFQKVGGMDSGFNKREIYELKKLLSASARILKGFDIKNLKFFIQLFVVEETKMDEYAILQHLFFPTDGWDASMSPESIDENNFHDDDHSTGDVNSQNTHAVKDPLQVWIARYWDETHGFILPLRSNKGGVRFTTRDIISPAFYEVYEGAYPKPATITFDYLIKMYQRADVKKEVDACKRLGWSLDNQIEIAANS